MTNLRLLLIDPHAVFREAARKYLLRCREFRSVEVAADYNEGLLLYAQYFPDLILVDSEYLSKNPVLIHELEKLKEAHPSLDVLALLLFRDDYIHRCRMLSSPVSGFIYKENFSESLLEYLSARPERTAVKQTDSTKEAD